MITLNFNVTGDLPGIHEKLDKIIKQGEFLMAKVEELEAELVKANETTNEIAKDVEDLLAKLAAGGLTAVETAATLASLKSLNARLTGVAASHTPV